VTQTDELLDLLRRMREIRFFEDTVKDWFTRALVRGSTHLYQGQEAVAVGVCSALRAGDTTTCTYRGHGTVLAHGAPLDRTSALVRTCKAAIDGNELVLAIDTGSAHTMLLS